MNRIHLISWDKVSINKRLADLKTAGFEVSSGVPKNRDFFRGIEEELPDAVLIDLSHSPSQGRDVAVNLRILKTTRLTPIVFLDGTPETITPIRQLLPDAIFSTWGKAIPEIRRAAKQPLLNPIVPSSVFAAYTEVPLAKKLGIKPGMSLITINAPVAVDTLLGPLPEGTRLSQNDSEKCDIMFWFIQSQAGLANEIEAIASRKDFKSVWTIWPKRTSSLSTDLTQQIVREGGLAHGLVDYKICSLNETWTGLCFARRKPSTK